MGTILLFILILGVLILVHEGGHFFAAKRAGVLVHEFGFGFPPRIYAKKVGETEYSINVLPFGGFVRLEGEDGSADSPSAGDTRSFANKPLSTKLLIVLAGVAMNWLLAALVFGILSTAGAPVSVADDDIVEGARVLVTGTAQDSPASDASVGVGEQIVALSTDADSATPTRIDEVQAFLSLHAGEEVMLTLARDDSTRMVAVTPRINPPQGEGAVGISLMRIAHISHPVYEAPWRGMFLAGSLTIALADGFGDAMRTFFVERQPVEGLAGPIGIAYLTGEVRSLGFLFLLNFIAILSLNLALLNIFPFPALDGGRAVVALFEKMRGRTLSARILGRINATGFAVLLVLLVLVTIKDFQNYIL